VDVVLAGPVRWSQPRELPLTCLVQLRAHGQVHEATVSASADGVAILLSSASRGVAPGQTAVLYDGDIVLGSATITGAHVHE
jgi:tRNA-specific 2-thiouridylase